MRRFLMMATALIIGVVLGYIAAGLALNHRANEISFGDGNAQVSEVNEITPNDTLEGYNALKDTIIQLEFKYEKDMLTCKDMNIELLTGIITKKPVGELENLRERLAVSVQNVKKLRDTLVMLNAELDNK